MKRLRLLACLLISSVSLCSASDTLAEKQLAPVVQVEDLLKKIDFSRARIGLDHEGPESHTDGAEFREKGFFKRNIFEIEVTAAEGKDLTSKMNAQKLIFTFNDKQESENFNAGFRRAIQLCSK
jgi:hypothetical protein